MENNLQGRRNLLRKSSKSPAPGCSVHIKTYQREGDFLGESALFFKDVHSTNVRSLGNSIVLTVDKKNFMRVIQEDPTIAFRPVQNLIYRVKELSGEISVLDRTVQEWFEEQLRLQDLEEQKGT